MSVSVKNTLAYCTTVKITTKNSTVFHLILISVSYTSGDLSTTLFPSFLVNGPNKVGFYLTLGWKGLSRTNSPTYL